MNMRIARFDLAQEVIPYRLARIAFAAGNDLHTAFCQFRDESLTGTRRQNHIHVIQRMFAAGEFMDGHIHGKIKPHDLGHITRCADLEYDETAALPGMAGHTPEILAGNGDFHDLVPLCQLSWK
jgi:hypothetical protein